MGYMTLEELIQNRKELIRVHQSNNFTNGIRSLLTDLYPDSAHFIYELLQNAEDMLATKVIFQLREDRLVFKHNGTKRDFNLNDIDAITNIGFNAQKKDDVTSIGKFGVGFKAVYAYTTTPEIHSGPYHFQIHDYFVPCTDSIQPINTRDSDGSNWTIFILPFNHPKKDRKTACSEIESALINLNQLSILFLNNIHNITYRLPGGRYGYLESREDQPHFMRTQSKVPGMVDIYESFWLHFSKNVDFIDDQGNQKKLTVAIAYSREFDPEKKEWNIVPAYERGKAFIYFPAEKEHTGLRFHINGPFASTVARDSIRDCAENKWLLEQIADLMEESFQTVKEAGLMNYSFINVLPNSKDGLSTVYRLLAERARECFMRNAYLPRKDKQGYVKAMDALIGSSGISSLFSYEDLMFLDNLNKQWILVPSKKLPNAEAFLTSLSIRKFSELSFSCLFLKSSSDKLIALLKTKDIDWVRKFYQVCSDVYDNSTYQDKKSFLSSMLETPFIRGSDGDYHKPDELLLLNDKTIKDFSVLVVDPELFRKTAGKEKLMNFFQSLLKIETYGKRIEIKLLAKQLEDQLMPGPEYPSDYFEKLTKIVDYWDENGDIDLSEYTIFIGDNPYYRHCLPVTSKALVLGPEYGNESGKYISSLSKKPVLWAGYKENLDSDQLDKLLKALKQFGMVTKLSLEICDCRTNPLFATQLQGTGKGVRSYTNRDYTIPYLEEMLCEIKQTQDIAYSKLIWDCLSEAGSAANFKPEYLEAVFSTYKKGGFRSCPASYITILKEFRWVPDKQGNFYKPEDVQVEDLHPSFQYYSSNKILSALEIGGHFDKVKQEILKIQNQAKKMNLHVISEDEWKILERVKSSQIKKNTQTVSGKELLQNQSKEKRNPDPDKDEYPESSGAVRNVARREKNIRETFSEQTTDPDNPVRRYLSTSYSSSEEEKTQLEHWYLGYCQICRTKIVKHDNSPYFVAKNIIKPSSMPDSVRNTDVLAWNSLCLCPNCAAKYDYCAKDMSSFYDQVMEQTVENGQSDPVDIDFVMDGIEESISFVPKHFLALQTVLKMLDQEAIEHGEEVEV